jgi:hypothetical protein
MPMTKTLIGGMDDDPHNKKYDEMANKKKRKDEAKRKPESGENKHRETVHPQYMDHGNKPYQNIQKKKKDPGTADGKHRNPDSPKTVHPNSQFAYNNRKGKSEKDSQKYQPGPIKYNQ